jgi:hypothetical protein
MRRREFITLLGSAAAAWPVMARAQQPERVRRIGVLLGLSANDPEGEARLGAFSQALHQFGVDRRVVALPTVTLTAHAPTRRNWSRSRPTSF